VPLMLTTGLESCTLMGKVSSKTWLGASDTGSAPQFRAIHNRDLRLGLMNTFSMETTSWLSDT